MTQPYAANKKFYFLPLVAAFAARVASVLFIDKSLMNPAPGLPGILMEYGVIAKNMLAGSGFAYSWFAVDGHAVVVTTAYMPPGQVWIDYFCLSLFGNSSAGVYAVFGVNVILSVLSVLMIGKLTREFFATDRLEKIALWCAALYPPFLYATATFGITTPVILIASWTMLECVKFIKAFAAGRHSMKYALCASIGFGILFYFRGEAPLLLLFTIAYIAWALRKQLRSLLPTIALMIAVPFAMISPWTIRNYTVLDRFVLISSNGGFNFWRGNNALTTGSPWTESGSPLWATDEQRTKLEQYLGRPAEFDRESSKMYINDALSWIKANPTDAAMLVLKKGLIFWTFDTRSRMGGTLTYMTIYLVTLLLFLFGLFTIRRDKTSSFGIRLILLWTIVATVIAMIFFPLPRLQVLMIAAYFPIVAYGTDAALQRLPLFRKIVCFFFIYFRRIICQH